MVTPDSGQRTVACQTTDCEYFDNEIDLQGAQYDPSLWEWKVYTCQGCGAVPQTV